MSSIFESSQRDIQWENRRGAVRKTIRLKALVLLPDDSLLEAHTVNVSIGGACLSVPKPLIVGEECRMHLEVAACGEVRRVLLVSKVCYRTGDDGAFQIGVRFVQLNRETLDFLTTLLQ